MQCLDDSLGKFQLERLKTVNAYHKNADTLSVRYTLHMHLVNFRVKRNNSPRC